MWMHGRNYQSCRIKSVSTRPQSYKRPTLSLLFSSWTSCQSQKNKGVGWESFLWWTRPPFSQHPSNKSVSLSQVTSNIQPDTNTHLRAENLSGWLSAGLDPSYYACLFNRQNVAWIYHLLCPHSQCWFIALTGLRILDKLTLTQTYSQL